MPRLRLTIAFAALVWAVSAAATPSIAQSSGSPEFFRPDSVPLGAASATAVPTVLDVRVFVVTPDGRSVAVDPNRHRFVTGEKFFLQVAGSLPGLFATVNINPAGVRTVIGDRGWLVDGASAVRLPPAAGGAKTFEMAERPGNETLIIKYWPCRNNDADFSRLPTEISKRLQPCSGLDEKLADAGTDPRPESIILSPPETTRSIDLTRSMPASGPMTKHLVLQHVSAGAER